jgi:hypothetical protein
MLWAQEVSLCMPLYLRPWGPLATTVFLPCLSAMCDSHPSVVSHGIPALSMYDLPFFVVSKGGGDGFGLVMLSAGIVNLSC